MHTDETKWNRDLNQANKKKNGIQLAAEFKWKIVCGKVHQGQNLIRQALNLSSCFMDSMVFFWCSVKCYFGVI